MKLTIYYGLSQLGLLLHDLFINNILSLGLALGWMVNNLLLPWLLHGDVQQLHGFPWVLTPSLVIAGLSSALWLLHHPWSLVLTGFSGSGDSCHRISSIPGLSLGSSWSFIFSKWWGRSITTAVLLEVWSLECVWLSHQNTTTDKLGYRL